jgi:glycosyltransferase involved in cell wall biosynthesis
VLKLSAEERKALGEAARNRVLESFSLSSVVRRYEELYLKYGKQGMGQLEEKACVA